MIERDVFLRRIVSLEKAMAFGFMRVNDVYTYEREIYQGMIARVTISSVGEVTGEVYDKELGEIYVNHRLESAMGAFVVGVRNAYEALLYEIAAAISSEKRYVHDQANRIDEYIKKKYCVEACFLWEKFPHFGVYRNNENGKWFAIIMNIDKGKIVKGESGRVEVMNVKLDEKSPDYYGNGIYPAYHMNHINWVTVLLDGTLDDSIITEMLEISYRNSHKGKKRR